MLIAGLAWLSRPLPKWVARYWANRFMTPVKHRRPGWEAELLKSATPLGIGALRAWSWGTGPVVLLIHGWDGRGSQLGKFVGPLIEAGFKVVTWDEPAHGDTPGKRTHLIETTAALMEVAQKVGPIYGMIAHSFGGGVAVLGIRQGIQVQKLVLIAAPSSIQGVFDRFTTFIRITPRASQEFQKYLEQTTGRSVQDVEPYLLRFAKNAPETLLIHAPDDADVPLSESERMANGWPRAQLLRMHGLGHRRILKDPEVTEEATEFMLRGMPE